MMPKIGMSGGYPSYNNDDDERRLIEIRNSSNKEHLIGCIMDNVINMHVYYSRKYSHRDIDTTMIQVIGRTIEDNLRSKFSIALDVDSRGIYNTNLKEDRIECNYNIQTGNRILLSRKYEDLNLEFLTNIAIQLEIFCQEDIYKPEWHAELKRIDAENKRNFLKKITEDSKQNINIIKVHR